ncbi:MAG TPA: hypothetical protein VLK23_14815 [Thermodesulfobacteriota bacterium]|nr:hypothetical protein [Thermodesulfobacteriota bacterium]
MKPANPEEYLKKTEHAVLHLYQGLASCWAYYERALQFWDVTKAGQPLSPEKKANLDLYLKLAGKYLDLKFSEATFAGSILQVAAMGIRYFSRNETIPASCVRIVPPTTSNAIAFCVGKELYGLPVGLIIYAARNQYNHWDEKPHDVTMNVFGALSNIFHDSILYDLAFDISNPSITIYANEVLLAVLGWNTYAKYEAEFQDLLSRARGEI